MMKKKPKKNPGRPASKDKSHAIFVYLPRSVYQTAVDLAIEWQVKSCFPSIRNGKPIEMITNSIREFLSSSRPSKTIPVCIPESLLVKIRNNNLTEEHISLNRIIRHAIQAGSRKITKSKIDLLFSSEKKPSVSGVLLEFLKSGLDKMS